jgi:hypothetical protein
MTGIGTVADYKEKMYKNEVCRKKKVSDGNNKTWQEEKKIVSPWLKLC